MLILGVIIAIIAIWQFRNIINTALSLYLFISSYISTLLPSKKVKAQMLEVEIQTSTPTTREISIQTESIPTISISTQTESKFKRPKPRMVEMGVQTDYVPPIIREKRIPIVQEVFVPIFIERNPVMPTLPTVPPAPRTMLLGTFSELKNKHVMWKVNPNLHDHPLLRLALYYLHNDELLLSSVCYDVAMEHCTRYRFSKQSLIRDKINLMMAKKQIDNFDFAWAIKLLNNVSKNNQVMFGEAQYQLGKLYLTFWNNGDDANQEEQNKELARKHLKVSFDNFHRGAYILYMTHFITESCSQDIFGMISHYSDKHHENINSHDLKLVRLMDRDVAKNAPKYHGLITVPMGDINCRFISEKDMSIELEELSKPEYDIQNLDLINRVSQDMHAYNLPNAGYITKVLTQSSRHR